MPDHDDLGTGDFHRDDLDAGDPPTASQDERVKRAVEAVVRCVESEQGGGLELCVDRYVDKHGIRHKTALVAEKANNRLEEGDE